MRHKKKLEIIHSLKNGDRVRIKNNNRQTYEGHVVNVRPEDIWTGGLDKPYVIGEALLTIGFGNDKLNLSFEPASIKKIQKL